MNNYLSVLEKVHLIAKDSGRNPDEITVVAVSKTHPIEGLLSVYEAGCRNFGENRVPEALAKKDLAPIDIKWHFIGTLQKNKVTKIVGNFSLIHSVDSFDLAEKISEVGERLGIVTPILLQVNTSGEFSKHGLNEEGWKSVIDSLQKLPFLSIQGLMTMAPLTEDTKIIRETFSKLRIFKETLLSQIDNKKDFKHLSMGMSHDYKIAIEEGATLLRIGTEIFGNRQTA